MPSLLIDMPSGVAGDMLLAALIDLGADRDRVEAGLAGLGVGPLPLVVEPAAPGGIAATSLRVDVPQDATWQPTADHSHSHSHDHDHDHRTTWPQIRTVLQQADLPDRVRQRALAVFGLLAQAEAQVHGVDPETIHFHEVGSLDAIADVVGCCLALELLAVDRVVIRPLTLGQGHVRCAHGRMPVPVPAVQQMIVLRQPPCRHLDQDTGELTTPTGCALALGLADSFVASDLGPAQATGYGAGHKTIPGLTNLIRVSLHAQAPLAADQVIELQANLDDATGEEVGLLIELAMAAGARDAWATPIMMKKGRPAFLISVLAAPTDQDALTRLLLSHSPSLGVRHQRLDRTILARREETIEHEGQIIRLKVATRPDGSESVKVEADDLAALVQATGRKRSELDRAVLDAYDKRS